MTLYKDIMPYFDIFIHVYGLNLSILLSPLQIWTPQNFTTANVRHPVSKSWLSHCMVLTSRCRFRGRSRGWCSRTRCCGGCGAGCGRGCGGRGGLRGCGGGRCCRGLLSGGGRHGECWNIFGDTLQKNKKIIYTLMSTVYSLRNKSKQYTLQLPYIWYLYSRGLAAYASSIVFFNGILHKIVTAHAQEDTTTVILTLNKYSTALSGLLKLALSALTTWSLSKPMLMICVTRTS